MLKVPDLPGTPSLRALLLCDLAHKDSRPPTMLLDLRTDSNSTATASNNTPLPEASAGDAAQLLINVCIAFAVLETFFIIAFVLSWHLNRVNNNNTKGVYALILVGYLFCFLGVIMGIRMSAASIFGSDTDGIQ
jgi:hypothetical protein